MTDVDSRLDQSNGEHGLMLARFLESARVSSERGSSQIEAECTARKRPRGGLLCPLQTICLAAASFRVLLPSERWLDK